jgi:hypothetical protein
MLLFVFHGSGSRFANAVFSSQASAETWIARHGLTGLLTEYDMDSPAFDRQLKDGNLPRDIREQLIRGASSTTFAQQYVDGGRHRHYFHGLGEDSPDFFSAMERWHREHGEINS